MHFGLSFILKYPCYSVIIPKYWVILIKYLYLLYG